MIRNFIAVVQHVYRIYNSEICENSTQCSRNFVKKIAWSKCMKHTYRRNVCPDDHLRELAWKLSTISL